MRVKEKKLFRKYRDNRRLWNVTDSTYATVESVMYAVVEGHEVQVLALPGKAARHRDSMEEDITHVILVDALARREHSNPTLSVEALHRLIRGEDLTGLDMADRRE